MAYHRGREAQEPAPAATGSGRAAVTGDGGAEGFDANMAIILAALFLALMFAIGLNSLSRCALLRRWGWGRRGDGDAADAAPGGVKVKKRALRSIPVEVYGGGGEGKEEEVCAICLGEFADGEKVRVLPRCGHGFHVRCVDAWLLSRGSCPTCRRPVTGDAPEKGGGGGGVGQSSRPPDGDNIAVVVT